MRLSDRIRQAESQAGEHGDWPRPIALRPADLAPPDALFTFKAKVQDAMFERLGQRLFDSSVGEEQLHSYVVREIGELMADRKSVV